MSAPFGITTQTRLYNANSDRPRGNTLCASDRQHKGRVVRSEARAPEARAPEAEGNTSLTGCQRR
jgi:hypothetical protein